MGDNFPAKHRCFCLIATYRNKPKENGERKGGENIKLKKMVQQKLVIKPSNKSKWSHF